MAVTSQIIVEKGGILKVYGTIEGFCGRNWKGISETAFKTANGSAGTRRES